MDATHGLPPEVWDALPSCVRELVAAQAARIASLEAKVAEFAERLDKNSGNSSRPPSADPPWVKRKPPRPKSGRKRGGQPGHERAVRPLVPPEQVAETVDHHPDHCNHCGEAFAADAPAEPEPLRHQTAELPPVRPHVAEHRLHARRCPHCEHVTRARPPREVGPGRFGPRLTALVALLGGRCRLGHRPIARLLKDAFGLDVSLGMVAKLQRKASDALAAPDAEILAHVRQGNVNVDETGWRQAGDRAWLWGAVGKAATVFRIFARRSAKAAKDLLGEGFANIATCDRFGAYNWIPRRQFCWAHAMRDFQAMVDRKGAGAKIGKLLLEHGEHLFPLWAKVRDGTMTRDAFKRRTRDQRAVFVHDLERGAGCSCATTAGTCKKLLGAAAGLWTFADAAGIEPTNNAAERALRHAVMWRRTSFGTQSERGSRFVERILSVAATCRQQAKDLFGYLADCIDARRRGLPAPSIFTA